MRTIRTMPLEIERKFLIAMPDLEWLMANQTCKVAKITQTYLGKNKEGYGNRVRIMEVDRRNKVLSYCQKNASRVHTYRNRKGD